MLINALKHLSHLIYPSLCVACNRVLAPSEPTICLVCEHELALTSFEKYANNQVEKIFWGRTAFRAGCSLLFFNKNGSTRSLMQLLKYQGREDIGKYLGKVLGHKMKASARFDTVQMVIPVPLHPKRKHQRGYNQCTTAAVEIAAALGVEFSPKILRRTRYNVSQTKKGRVSRWTDSEDLFSVNTPSLVKNKHILIVDDVLTTGATLEACAKAFTRIEGIQLSFATLAYTY